MVESDMKIEDFKNVLVWLKKRGIRKILLTGGEPFFHKDIKKILESCQESGFSTYILTNGLLVKAEVREYLKDKAVSLILNVNLDNSYYVLRSNMSGIEGKVVLIRYNFNKRSEDYTLLFRMAKEYSVPIRFGFTVPSRHADNECYSFEDMLTYKQQIMDFVKSSRLNSVRAYFSRPLPRCIFSEIEWRHLKRYFGAKSRCLVGDAGNYLSRAIINPDLSVDVCYASLFKASLIFDFKELKYLNSYFKYKFDAIRNKPLMDKCNNCRYHKDSSCQGGCLIYKYVS